MGQVNSAIRRIQENDPKYTDTNEDLVEKNLIDEHAQTIAQALCCKEKNGYGNTNLVELYLHCNNISAAGAKALAHALTSKDQGGGGNNTLKRLILNYNNIGDSGAEALAHTLGPEGGNTSLEYLWILDNNITDKGIKHLADALRVNSSLKSITLNDNPITDEGAQYLWEALQENTSLAFINLFENDHIKDKSLKERIHHLVYKRNSDEPETRKKEAAEIRKRREEIQRQNQPQKDADKANSAAIGSGSTGGNSLTVGTTASSSSSSSSLKGTQEATIETTTAEHRKKRDEKQSRIQQHTNTTNSDAGNSIATRSSSAGDDKSLTTAVSSSKEPEEPVEFPHNITAQEIDELRTHVIQYTQWAIHSYDIPTTLERENESKVLQFIEANAKMQPFYGSLNSILYDYFIAAMSVRTGDVALETWSKNKRIVSSLLSALLQGLPILSQVSSTLDTVVKGYVSLDTTRAMNNLLSVAPAHTKILESVQQLACNITLGLKDVHIDKLDSTKNCRGIWRQVKDRVMSKEPTNVYEEEGMVCGMAIVKLCMKGNVTSECFNAEELLHVLGYDRKFVRDALQYYRSVALAANAGGGAGGTSATPRVDLKEGQDINNLSGRLNRVEQEVWSAESGNGYEDPEKLKGEIDTLRTEIASVRGEASNAKADAKAAKAMAEKRNQNDGMDVGNGASAQQQLPSSGTSSGQSSNRKEFDSLHIQVEQLKRQLHEVTDVASDIRKWVNQQENSGDQFPSGGPVQYTPSSPVGVDEFNMCEFSFDFAVQTIKQIIDESPNTNRGHYYSRYPTPWGKAFLKKVSIADRLKGGCKEYPDTVRGVQILRLFKNDVSLAAIDHDWIRDRFHQAWQEASPQ